MDTFKNFAKATVSTGYNNAATTVVLSSGHGALLPTAGGGVGFNVVWYNATDYTDPTDDPNVEIVRVTNRSADTLTVTRGQEGTTATSKNAGGKTYKMIATLTAETVNDLLSSSGSGSGAVALSGSTSGTVTVTVANAAGTHTIKLPTADGSANQYVKTDGAGQWSFGTPSGGSSTVYPVPPSLRLTTETGVPNSQSDRTAQGTLYYTPYQGGRLDVYSGSAWASFNQAQLSLALSGLTSGKNYDVFVSYNSGTPALALSAAWTNDTTRADALATQDGMLVKSADHTLLWVGTIRTTGTTTTEDSLAKRFVWNAYNRLLRFGQIADAGSHTTTSTTWRDWNGSALQVQGVVGAPAWVRNSVSAYIQAGTTDSVNLGLGLNWTSGSPNGPIAYSTFTTNELTWGNSTTTLMAAGYNYFSVVERSAGGGTATLEAVTTAVDWWN